MSEEHINKIINFYNKYSVFMKLEWSEFNNSCKISLLYLLSFEATKVLIEKERRASKTLNVPTAEFFLPVKGYTSGPL